MSSIKPIKTEVFRFLTIRAPNHISTSGSSNRSFIYAPSSVVQKMQDTASKAKSGDALKTLTDQVKPFASYQEVRAIQPALYDFSCVLYQKRKRTSGLSFENLTAKPMSDKEMAPIWEQLLYQTITSASSYVRQACVQMIVANHFLNKDKISTLKELANAKIVIPEAIITMRRDLVAKPCERTKLMGVTNLGIADFRRVEQELCCYVPGEVSSIENIMAREYKERSTRNLTRSETTLEFSSEVEVENLSDTTSTSRHELSNEVAKVITEDESSNYGGSLGVSAKWGAVTVNANAHLDFANNNSLSLSNTRAEQYAEEMTTRALERIVRKTSEKRTYKMLREFEENNKHGYDNREGDFNISGVYRWVDKIYTNQLVNYGKRLMIEFVIPEPARFFKNAMNFVSKTATGNNTNDLVPPKKLEDIKNSAIAPATTGTIPAGIKVATDINRENYEELAQMYGIVIAPPKAPTTTERKTFTPTPPFGLNDAEWSQAHSDVSIPQDYELDKLSGVFDFTYKSLWPFPPSRFGYNIAGHEGGTGYQDNHGGLRTVTGEYSRSEHGNIYRDFTPNYTGTVGVSFRGVSIYGFSVTVNFICNLKPAKYLEWQTKAYADLKAAYEDQLDKYNKALAAQAAEAEATTVGAAAEKRATNPAFNRITEQRELKRAAIEMLMHPFCKDIGLQMYTTTDCCGKVIDPKAPKDPKVTEPLQIPFITQTPALVEYANQVRFFEEAFDWNIMSYLFYPYYWADKCLWAELLKEEDGDLIFQAFKQAGMARIIVPVRVESTEGVLYYMETGEIWTGGDLVPSTKNEKYESIIAELKQQKPQNEGEPWETRVPSTLTILQDSTAGLKEEGLPCCGKIIKDLETSHETLGLYASNVKLQDKRIIR
jgi:hypothetical protein